MSIQEIPNQFVSLFNKEDIKIIYVPFDSFRFPDDYLWALAFYKLCAVQHVAKMGYDAICYLDADVYIQGNFDPIWAECNQNILLYDINHSLNVRDYNIFCDEIEGFTNERRLITHFGGEFFAANTKNAQKFVDKSLKIYQDMMDKNFVTTRGDEFIISLVADDLKLYVKNAGGYIFRFWTSLGFRLVSTCYKYNKVVVLHMPNEKMRGIHKLYKYYIKNNCLPPEKSVWRICQLVRPTISEQLRNILGRIIKQ